MEDKVDEAIGFLTKMFIEQHIKAKEDGKEYITIKKEDLIKLCIDMLKLIKKI